MSLGNRIMKTSIFSALIGSLYISCALADNPVITNKTVVTASRIAQAPDQLLGDVTIITREEIEKQGQTTLPELLQRQPGLELTNNGGPGTISGIFIRGANSAQTLFLIDGMRISSVTSGTAALEHIPLSQIERIEILRGPASSLYGADAVGGVIQIFTRKSQGSPQPRIKLGYGSHNTRTMEAGYGGQLGNTRFNLNLAQYDTEGINNTRRQHFAFNPDQDSYRNDSVNFSLAHALTENHEIGLRFLQVDARIHFDSGLLTNDFTDQDQRNWALYSKNRFLPDWESTLTIGSSTDNQKTFGGFPNTYRTEEDQYYWQNNINTGIGTLLLGTERIEQKLDSSVAYSGRERNIQSYLAGWLGNYGAHDIQLNLRNDRNSQFGNRTTGSASYGYRFLENWRSTVGYGTAFRAPNFNDLYYPGPFAKGNPDLKPERSRNKEIGLHYQKMNHQLSAVAFENRVDDLIDLQGALFLPVNVSSAKLRGITLSWKATWNDLTAYANADIQSPRDEDSGNLLRNRAQRHGNAGIEQRFGSLKIGGELTASSMRYDDAANTVGLDGYALVNLYASYKIHPDWIIETRANNILDKDYELVSNYNTMGANLFVSLAYSPN